MKKKSILHLLSFVFFTFLFVYWLFFIDSKSDSEIYAVPVVYLMFAVAPLLSLALQYEVIKDKEFFNNFTSSTTKVFKMNDYLRISFLLLYNLGAYAGIQMRKKILKKETEDGCLWVVMLGDSFHSTSCISKVVYKEALNICDLKLFIFCLIKKNVQHC